MSRAVRRWSLSTWWRRVNAVAWLPLVAAALYLMFGPTRASTAGRGLLLLIAGLGYLAFVLRPAWEITLDGPSVQFRGPLRTRIVAAKEIRAVRSSRFVLIGQWPIVVETAHGRVTLDPHIADLDGFVAALRGVNPGVSTTGLSALGQRGGRRE